MRHHHYGSAQFSKVGSVYRHLTEEILEVEYTDGHIVRMTDAHSVFTVGDHGELMVKPAGDLKPGEANVAKRQMGDKLVSLPYGTWGKGASGAARHRKRPIDMITSIPDTPLGPLSKGFASLLGLWLAEGYIHEGKHIDWCFSMKEEDLQNKVSAFAATLDRKSYRKPTKAGGAVNCGFSHAQLARWIRANFGRGSHDKHLPEWAFTLPTELFDPLVNGWAQGDGYQRRGRVAHIVTTVSKKLATDMVWACRLHGRSAAMHSRPYDGFASGICYQVNINPRGVTGHRPMVKAVRRVPYHGFVYDFCGCEGEAFYGGEMPILLHNTNRPDMLDAALRRPGRFDKSIPFLIPNESERADIFRVMTKRYLGKAVDASAVLPLTQNWTGAEIEGACVKAAEIVEDEVLAPQVAIEQAIKRFRPNTQAKEYMTLIAIRECNDLDLLPKEWQDKLMNRDTLEAKIAELRPGTPARSAREI